MSEDVLLLWGFGLMAGAILVFALELIIPSAGVLSLIALGLGIGSVVAFWSVSTAWGVIALLTLLVLIPIAIFLAIKVIPHTPMGKGLFMTETASEQELFERAQEKQAEKEAAQALIGAVGTALTDLHPSGRVELDGARVDALAIGGLIEQGAHVRVVEVAGNEVKVRAV